LKKVIGVKCKDLLEEAAQVYSIISGHYFLGVNSGNNIILLTNSFNKNLR